MAAFIALLAMFGGGNAGTTIPATDFVGTALELQTEHDPDLAPAPYHFVDVTEMVAYSDPVEHEAMLFQWDAPNRNSTIDATPTAEEAAIVPMVTAGQPGSGSPGVHSNGTVNPVFASSNLAPSLNDCPAVIVETFGEHAPAACAVAWCESHWRSDAVGDGGRSLGLFQLWTGWAAWYGVEVDALFDPAVNAAVARAVFEYRGRWGGAGGWTCADLLNIP